MRTARTTAIAGALVFFGLLAPKAMAEQAKQLSTINLDTCSGCVGHWCCELQGPEGNALNSHVILTDEQFKALKTVPAPTKDAIKRALEMQ